MKRINALVHYYYQSFVSVGKIAIVVGALSYTKYLQPAMCMCAYNVTCTLYVYVVFLMIQYDGENVSMRGLVDNFY